MIAPASTDKTAALCMTNLLLWRGPVVVLDVKGELYAQAAEYRRQVFGRRVHRLDPFRLAEHVFVRGFGRAFSTYLHEHAHLFGNDGSRLFTDALTNLIEGIVTDRRHLDECASRWEAARLKVLDERLAARPESASAPSAA